MHPSSSSSTTWSSCAASPAGHCAARGRVLADGPVAQIQEDPRVGEVYLGRSGSKAATRCWTPAGRTSSTAAATRCWDISLDVPAGELVCLMGRNGVGKTTLLKAIMGLLPACRAVSLRRRRPPAGAGRTRGRARGIGFVPQGREIFPSLTVEENLMVGRLALLGKSDLREKVLTCSRCSSVLRRRGGDLSGGQQQQLAMGRALGSAEAADPRRADRGHPAEHRGGDRRRHLPPRRRGGDGADGRAEARLRASLRPQLRDPRPRTRGRDRRNTADLTDDLVRRHLTV